MAPLHLRIPAGGEELARSEVCAQAFAATDERIAVWNEHGRRLCAAFLETVAQPAASGR